MLGVLVVLAVIVMVTHFVLQGDKDRLLNGHRRMAALEARTLAEMVTLQIGALNVWVDGLAKRQSNRLSPADLNPLVQGQPLLRSASLLDGEGRVTASSNPANVGLRVDVSSFYPFTEEDIDYFRIGGAWAGKDIGQGYPLSAGPTLGEQNPDGGFFLALREMPRSGTAPLRLLLAIDTNRIQQNFQDWLHVKGGEAEIHRFDGARLVGEWPSTVDGPTRTAALDSTLKLLALRDYGELVLRGKDGGTRFTAYHASADFPLFSTVTYAEGEILAEWGGGRTRIWLLVLSVVAVALLALVALYRRWEQSALLRQQQVDQLRLYAAVYTHSVEAITITDVNANIVAVNDAHVELTGFTPAEVVGKTPKVWSSGQHGPEFFQTMWTDLKVRKAWSGEIWNRRKDGEVIAERLNIFAVPNEEGQTAHYVAMSQNITEAKKRQNKLQKMAYFDLLTQLPNRILLHDRLRQALAVTRRTGLITTVVFIDLDGFKAVNDRYGHAAGDTLLIALAQRLRRCLRDSDTLARLGGDEFVAVLVNQDSSQECEQVLARLLAAASEPVELEGVEQRLTASMGVAVYPRDGDDTDILLRNADQAMYAAKQAGKNRYQFFNGDAISEQRHLSERRALFASALDNREFVLFYQPKINLRTKQVVGAEALVRWRSPTQGLLSPAAFLPDVEGHALISRLGDWVLAEAIAQMAVWSDAGLSLQVGVNISAHQLQTIGFAAKLASALQAQPSVNPQCLQLEILETSAFDDVQAVADVMRDCRSLGVTFALDDFGTGYSSLTYLKQLPAKWLKIDRSFVRDMLVDKDDLAIVHAVIGLAKAFRRQVVAEGVESKAHALELQLLGCDEAQGFGIAKPMPAGELAHWIACWQQAPDFQ